VQRWAVGSDLSAVTLQLAEYDPDLSVNWNASTDELDFNLNLEGV
jgi:hypothetical protein